MCGCHATDAACSLCNDLLARQCSGSDVLVRRDNERGGARESTRFAEPEMRPSISVAIAGLLCLSAYVSAQPNKQSYELQERCGKRAAEVFEREYGPVSN